MYTAVLLRLSKLVRDVNRSGIQWIAQIRGPHRLTWGANKAELVLLAQVVCEMTWVYLAGSVSTGQTSPCIPQIPKCYSVAIVWLPNPRSPCLKGRIWPRCRYVVAASVHEDLDTAVDVCFTNVFKRYPALLYMLASL
jgi:hypothetical protein